MAVPTINVLEPHQVGFATDGSGELTFVLQRVTYNTAIPATAFDPPVAAESLDVAALLREVGRNQDLVEKRVSEYAFMQKETDREISSKGEIKKETTKVYEVFPVANREPIMKLISENGVALSPERAAKESKRVEEEFLKAERDREKNEQRAERRRAERQRSKPKKEKAEGDDDPDVSQFLKICEFVSPRRERFRDRNAVVFDFRPRPGFKPSNREESLISKLVGVVWIDPVDKQVMRLEARLAEGFKMAGGLLLSLRPGAGFAIEQTRMEEGVWLPRLAQVNLSVKVLLFGGGDINKTLEWSDYKHFKGDVSDYKLEPPKPAEAGEEAVMVERNTLSEADSLGLKQRGKRRAVEPTCVCSKCDPFPKLRLIELTSWRKSFVRTHLKSDEPGTAPYLLKEELRRAESLVMEAAAATRVPAGAALAVDRQLFAEYITEKN